MTEYRSLIIVASRRASEGIYEDTSGPILVAGLESLGFQVDLRVVDDGEPVARELNIAIESQIDLVITSGGTGLTPRDFTPEMTKRFIEREVPGIAESLRADGVAHGIPNASLARGLAGIAGKTLIINLAGSPGAAHDGIRVLSPFVVHALDQMRGGDH